MWTCADGRRVLFNRRYRPILEQASPDAPWCRADIHEFVMWEKQEWFYNDGYIEADKVKRSKAAMRSLGVHVLNVLVLHKGNDPMDVSFFREHPDRTFRLRFAGIGREGKFANDLYYDPDKTLMNGPLTVVHRRTGTLDRGLWKNNVTRGYVRIVFLGNPELVDQDSEELAKKLFENAGELR